MSAASTQQIIENTPSSSSVFQAGRWACSLLVIGLASWVVYNNTPFKFEVPDRLVDVNAMSPQALQVERSVKDTEIYWKNTVIQLGLVGLLFGSLALFHYSPKVGSELGKVLGIVLAGGVIGIVAAFAGMALRVYFDSDIPIPMVSEEIRPLLCDGIVFGVVSLLLTFPVSLLLLLQGKPELRKKAAAVPLAGVLTGMLMPILSAIVLPASTSTKAFPFSGWALSGLWLGLLVCLIFLLMVLAGNRKKKARVEVESC